MRVLAIVVIKVQTGPVASAALEGSIRAFPAKCVRHAWRASILRQQHPNAQIVLVASILGLHQATARTARWVSSPALLPRRAASVGLGNTPRQQHPNAQIVLVASIRGLHQATARTARWVSSPALLPRRAASVGLGNTPRQQHPNAQIASVASIRGLRRATAQTVQRANTPACLLLALAQIVRSTLILMQEHASVLANPASQDRMVASASHVPLGNIKRMLAPASAQHVLMEARRLPGAASWWIALP